MMQEIVLLQKKKQNHVTTFYLFFPPKAGSDSKFELLVMQFIKSDSWVFAFFPLHLIGTDHFSFSDKV